MNYLKTLEAEILFWPNTSTHPHRFGGREFRFGFAEIGHVHRGGIVDIPFTRSIHNALLSDRLAEQHHWVPNSGWITFRIRSDRDISHALWLLRLSFVRYVLKTAADPHNLLAQEAEKLHLSPRFQSLLEPFIPRTTGIAS